jgi:hypothetical protein
MSRKSERSTFTVPALKPFSTKQEPFLWQVFNATRSNQGMHLHVDNTTHVIFILRRRKTLEERMMTFDDREESGEDANNDVEADFDDDAGSDSDGYDDAPKHKTANTRLLLK